MSGKTLRLITQIRRKKIGKDTLFPQRLPDNMDLEEAAECAGLVQAKHNIPYHIVEADDPEHFDMERAEEFSAPNKLILQPGEEITIE